MMDFGTQAPISIVELVVLSENGTEVGRTQTDTLGRFSLSWSGPEKVRLRAERIGFQPSTTAPFLVRAGEAVTVRMLMSVMPIRVDPLVISARDREDDIMGNFAEIERRKKLGIGHFINRDQIRQSGATNISEVLTRVPGIQLIPEATNPYSVSAFSTINSTIGASRAARRQGGRGAAGISSRGQVSAGSCPMMIFLDGRIHRYPVAGVNVLPATDIEAIEVYRGLAELPAEFAGEHARCGVIALWTTRRLN